MAVDHFFGWALLSYQYSTCLCSPCQTLSACFFCYFLGRYTKGNLQGRRERSVGAGVETAASHCKEDEKGHRRRKGQNPTEEQLLLREGFLA